MTATNAPSYATELRAEQKAHEPSMEEILASIRNIIADDPAKGGALKAPPPPPTGHGLLVDKVVIVANLAPRKLRGLESNGMIVAASPEGGKPVLAGFLEDVPVGTRLK